MAHRSFQFFSAMAGIRRLSDRLRHWGRKLAEATEAALAPPPRPIPVPVRVRPQRPIRR